MKGSIPLQILHCVMQELYVKAEENRIFNTSQTLLYALAACPVSCFTTCIMQTPAIHSAFNIVLRQGKRLQHSRLRCFGEYVVCYFNPQQDSVLGDTIIGTEYSVHKAAARLE